ncbi:MAG TPA: FecR domain-containing protein [Niastella sp.]
MEQDRSKRIEELIIKHLLQELSAKEKQELDQWVNSSERNRYFFEQVMDRDDLKQKWKDYSEVDETQLWQKITSEIPELYTREEEVPNTFKWRRIAIAAAIISIVACISWYFLLNNTGKRAEKNLSVIAKNDVSPGGNKAVLTLANGTKIILDNAKNGTLAQQGSTAITKDQGQVTYDASSSPLIPLSGNHSPLTFNTISTPRGGQFSVILPDGSQAWLNAASSIRFPVTFTGSERRVELTGEAYFEVASVRLSSGQKMPFKVVIQKAGGTTEVEVLGTHFNINAYDDETVQKTTLLEGKVKVTVQSSDAKNTRLQPSTILQPGQQAQVTETGTLRQISDVDTELAVAWKNGRFHFGTNIQTVMRQIARWYDVEIVYQGKMPEYEFVGQISRFNNVSEVLKLLEMTGGIHFQIKDKTIIVKP